MALQPFHLTRPPFDAAPDAAFYYEDAARRELLGALQYALKHGDGILKVTGEAGSGKSMLCAALAARFSGTVVRLAGAPLAPQDATYAIARQLGLEPDGRRSDAVLRKLDSHLAARHAEGRMAVLLVEEAQTLPLETLEELRLLTNLDAGPHKLLPIVLMGTPELNNVLRQARLRQLRERITLSFVLPPLPPDLAPELLDFRLRAAGHEGLSIIQLEAARLIAKTANGDLRRLIALAGHALESAAEAGAETVSLMHVKAVIKGGPPNASVKPAPQAAAAEAPRAAPSKAMPAQEPVRIPQLPAITMLPSADEETEPPPLAESESDLATGWEPEPYVQHAPPHKAVLPQQPQALPQPRPRTASRRAVWAGCAALAAAGVGGAAYLLQAAPVPVHAASGRVVQMAAAAQAKPAMPVPAPEPAPVTTVGSVPAAINTPAPAPLQTPAAPAAPAATSSATLKAAQTRGLTLDIPGEALPVAKPRQQGLLKQSLAASKTWLRDEPEGNFCIQIENLPAAERERAEQFLTDTRASIGLGDVHSYPMLIKGEPRIAIVYGSFASAKRALEVQNAYEERLGFRPKIRTIKGIRQAVAQATMQGADISR